MSGICIRCGMLSKSLTSNATCPECNANAQHYIGVGEKRMAQAIAELKERNRKQDDDIIDMREAIQKRDAEITALREVVRLGKKVILKLEEYGASIVPHLMDNDDNDGERFRQAIRALETTTNKEPL